LKTSPIQHYYSFIRYHRCSSKSDLEIPENSSKFISLSSFSIGLGGQELSHSHFTLDIIWSVAFGVLIAIIIPFYSFLFLKNILALTTSIAAYGSVSAVTFVTALLS
jgi:hypothetical protein